MCAQHKQSGRLLAGKPHSVDGGVAKRERRKVEGWGVEEGTKGGKIWVRRLLGEGGYSDCLCVGTDHMKGNPPPPFARKIQENKKK